MQIINKDDINITFDLEETQLLAEALDCFLYKKSFPVILDTTENFVDLEEILFILKKEIQRRIK